MLTALFLRPTRRTSIVSATHHLRCLSWRCAYRKITNIANLGDHNQVEVNYKKGRPLVLIHLKD